MSDHWRKLALALAKQVREDVDGCGAATALTIQALEAIEEVEARPDRAPMVITEAMVEDAMKVAGLAPYCFGAITAELERTAGDYCNEAQTPQEIIQTAIARYTGSRAAWVARGRPRGKTS